MLLRERPPAEIVPLLIPFLNHPSEAIRKDVACVIATVGAPLIIEPIRKAFLDTDDYVGSYAMMGLRRAMDGRHLEDRCKIELFSDLQELISAGKNGDKAAELLLDFDTPRATEFLLSPAVFSPDSPSLHHALNAMAERKIRVPHDRLLALIQQLEASELEYPRTYALGAALRLVGLHQSPDDLSLLQSRTAHTDQTIAEGAAGGLLASHGLEGFREKIWNEESNGGVPALSIPQQHFSAVTDLDAEVNNGGHSQYFVNSSGDQWKQALAGLEAMGCTERAAILREAVRTFGASGPSIDRKARQEELSKLARKDDELFDALDSRYYESKEIIDVFATRYVIANADSFK